MSRVLAVARREFLERVRSRAFLIGTLLGPLLLAALTVVPSLLVDTQRGRPLTLAVVDASGTLGASVAAALARRRDPAAPRFELRPAGGGAPEAELDRMRHSVLEGRLDGYLYLPPGVLEGAGPEYHSKSVTNLAELSELEKAVEDAVVERRLADAGMPADRIGGLLKHVDLKRIQISAGGEREDSGGAFFLAFGLMMALYSAVAMWGAALMNGVIEEKTSRVVEVIVSSIPSSRLFAGKLIGIGGAGLTQLSAWALALGGVAAYGALASGGGLRLPGITATALLLFVLYFLLGFFTYGALYSAVGAAVNSQQEAQSLMFPVLLPLVAGVMLFPLVLSRPDGPLSVALSLVPFWTPLLMTLRVATLMPPAWQIGLSLALSLATIALLTWAASRVFRVGILMYGKRPTFPEMLRWIRSG